MSKPNIFGNRVTAAELAEMLGITRQHLTRLCRAGSVPNAYQTKGGHWRFRWSAELESMVRASSSRGPGGSGKGNLGGPEAAFATRYLRSCVGKTDKEKARLHLDLGIEKRRLALVTRMMQKRHKAVCRAMDALRESIDFV